MRTLITTLIFISFWGCNGKDNSNIQGPPTDTTIQKINGDRNTQECILTDSLLQVYADEFAPSRINLDESIKDEFRNMMLNSDSSCLQRLSQYKFFVMTILAKLARHHEECCLIGYDLLSMKSGAAKIIVEEFEKMIGVYGTSKEFLHSFTAIDYIYSNDTLKSDPRIKKILEKIKYKPQK